MKKILVSSLVFSASIATAMARPTPENSPLYANTIASHNIGTIQQSVFNATLNGFDYYGLHVGRVAGRQTAEQNPDAAYGNPADLYGRMPMYGTMPMYGEWNDDGSATTGRSGGAEYARMPLATWAHWNHANETEHYDHLGDVHTHTDLIMAGVGTNAHRHGAGYFNMGAFAGYAGGKQSDHNLRIGENGGFVGFYSAYNIDHARFAATATLGRMNNSLPHRIGGGDFDNTWFAINGAATYDWQIDPTLTLQPGVQLAYTWVRADDYVVLNHATVKNTNIYMFDVTPTLRAIKHISDGWFGIAHARYAFRFYNGGDIRYMDHNLSALDVDDYVEYGIGIEKGFGPFNMAVEINRRDGGRDGWNGGARIKYAF